VKLTTHLYLVNRFTVSEATPPYLHIFMAWCELNTIHVLLRCVIPVVLSNNNNKLMVHMYVVKNTTIFLIVRLLLIRYNYMFRPSMLSIFRLYMKHLTISYIYT